LDLVEYERHSQTRSNCRYANMHINRRGLKQSNHRLVDCPNKKKFEDKEKFLKKSVYR